MHRSAPAVSRQHDPIGVIRRLGVWLCFCGLYVLAGCAAGDSEPLFTVNHAPLHESSGLATSAARPGVWFTHNDSGGEPRLFAFSETGEAVEEFHVHGANAEDWEDMAAGPCPGQAGAAAAAQCLYIGDIGDNRRKRDSVSVYAVPLPSPGDRVEVSAHWELRYPGKRKNAETLLVDPRSGRLYIVSKEDDRTSSVYRVPLSPGRGELERVARVRLESDDRSDQLITGGDWHPAGDRVVLRTYVAAYEWQVDAEDREAHWSEPPRRIELPGQRQGEAIAYEGERNLISTSEGRPMPVWRTQY